MGNLKGLQYIELLCLHLLETEYNFVVYGRLLGGNLHKASVGCNKLHDFNNGADLAYGRTSGVGRR